LCSTIAGLWADEQSRAFYIGQQNVGRMPAHGVAVGDDALGGHQYRGVPRYREQATGLKAGMQAMNRAKAPRLVHGQGVHLGKMTAP